MLLDPIFVSSLYAMLKEPPLTPLLATVLLLPQPRLQRANVGALHLSLDPRLLDHPCLHN